MNIIKFTRSALFFISTALIYQGITIVGWGILELKIYFFSIERLIYCIIVIFFSLGIGIQAFNNPEGIQERNGKRKRKIERQTIIGGILTGLLGLNLFFLP